MHLKQEGYKVDELSIKQIQEEATLSAYEDAVTRIKTLGEKMKSLTLQNTQEHFLN
ncbi:hypothetical protein CCP1ISM_60041 [Azospirillaceae bacterium]